MKNHSISSTDQSLENKANSDHKKSKAQAPLRVLINKEIATHIRSWRFIVLLLLIFLTFVAAIYVSLSNLKSSISNFQDPDRLFVYLKILTTTDNSIPPYHVFIGFLGPLLGIGLGFDAVNSEQNGGTLSRLLAQPIYRDNLLLSKFIAAILLVSVLFVALALLMLGTGLLLTGVRIELQEVLRIAGFVIMSILYVGFWLSLSILFSITFRQPATSALTVIGVWLFFTIFYPIVVNLLIRSFLPNPNTLTTDQWVFYNELILNLLRISPSQLYSDATTILLMPSVRSLGAVTMEQMAGAIPAPLPFRESILVVWPQISGMIAATTVCFAITYAVFMRREIRG